MNESAAKVLYLPSAGAQTSFRDFLLMAALSEKTVTIYSKSVDRAILWLGDRGADLAECSAADLVAWASTLPASTSAPRQARSAVQYYLGGWADRNKARAIRVPPKPRYVSQALSVTQAADLHHVALPRATRREPPS